MAMRPHELGFRDLRSDLHSCFADVVNSSSFEKSLRLVISYGALKRSTFIEALQERLEPKLKQVHAQCPAFCLLDTELHNCHLGSPRLPHSLGTWLIAAHFSQSR